MASGFFLPLSDFLLPIQVIGYLLPLTAAIETLQDILLRGISPSWTLWLILGAIAFVTFLLTSVFASRQLRFRMD